MAVAEAELTIQKAAPALQLAGLYRSVFILGEPTETNCALIEAFARQGQEARPARATSLLRLGEDDLVIGRVDVLATLDGIEPGLPRMRQFERQGVQLLNSPSALCAAHDKLTTALLLGRGGGCEPRPARGHDGPLPSAPPP